VKNIIFTFYVKCVIISGGKDMSLYGRIKR